MPTGPQWIHELKHDGSGSFAQDGDRVRLWSRNGCDWSAEFVAITTAIMALPVTRIVLNGEAVAAGLSCAPTPLWLRYSVLLRL